jgi:hypothetical protein
MEKALVLVTLTSKYPKGLPETLMKVSGVIDANFIYGPYDLYAIVERDTKEQLLNTITKIREMNGIRHTMTCNVASR